MLTDWEWDGVKDVPNLLALLRRGANLPYPGSGNTAARFQELHAMSARCPSLGRILEAHCDALAIFSDADIEPPKDMAFAVWASSSRSSVIGKAHGNGLLLNGTQVFCGGAGIVDGALMTVACDGGEQIVYVQLNREGVDIDLTSWKTPAFAQAAIGTVSFTNVEIGVDDFVGNLDFYSSRPGFWWGASGVAACWAGIAESLLTIEHERARSRRRSRDELALVSHGRTASLQWAMDACLAHAAHLIDESATDASQNFACAEFIALNVRQQVASAARDLLETVSRDAGPAPIAFDPEWSQVSTELRMALGQSHADRDLRQLGGLVLGFRAGDDR